MASHSADMLSKLRSQREAGLFCDITLRTNGRSYSAHRAVLAAVSDHFQEIFTEMDLSMKADIDLTGKKTYPEATLTLENITGLCSGYGAGSGPKGQTEPLCFLQMSHSSPTGNKTMHLDMCSSITSKSIFPTHQSTNKRRLMVLY